MLPHALSMRRGGYEQPLVDIEIETLPLEWSAALFESYAADHAEAMSRYHDTAPEAVAAARYSDTAHALAERIERGGHDVRRGRPARSVVSSLRPEGHAVKTNCEAGRPHSPARRFAELRPHADDTPAPPAGPPTICLWRGRPRNACQRARPARPR
ncbi:hypothetical protein [Streptomyces sp. NPDC052721]|uniref:hypothetical protein n=1 Tax=Streptomyces sp. NPDC052721 TaxID=3154955 RepID=UPI0034142147